MLYTILQIIAFQALFLLVYDLLLRKETFFNLNRIYLLLTSVVALVLPFIKLPELQKVTSKDIVIRLPEVFIGSVQPTEYDIKIAEQAGIIMEQPQTPVWQTMALIGIALATLLFIIKMVRLYSLKYNNPKRWHNSVLVVKLLKSTAVFSFFNTIFLGEQIPETEKSTIYKHELVHVKQWHTLDLLFFEALRILLWFNPLVYIYQNRIKELHEFIADAKAVKENGKKDYYQSLLNQVFGVQNISFTNTFFKTSLIKKRIAMLQKSKSRQLNLLKYALLIPLVFGMLIYTSTEVKAQENVETTQDANQELTDEELIEKYYNEILDLSKNEEFTFMKPEIRSKYDYTTTKYIPTKDEYLKYLAYLRFTGEQLKKLSEKSGRMTKEQKRRFEEMISFNKSYEEYLEYLKTDESKRLRDNALYNRTLRVISNDIDNLTNAEHQDAYEKTKDVLNGNLYKKLIISDANDSEEISKSNYDALVRFFSVDEIKTLLSQTNVKVQVSEDKVIEAEYDVEVPFSVIENVPTTIDCKDLATNEERKRCMSDFVTSFVNKNFNKSVTDTLGLKGRQRIFVTFKIDESGSVSFVNARAAHPALEDEAKRVINGLPQFIPGRQKGKPVVVPYSLPIVFQVTNDNKKKD